MLITPGLVPTHSSRRPQRREQVGRRWPPCPPSHRLKIGGIGMPENPLPDREIGDARGASPSRMSCMPRLFLISLLLAPALLAGCSAGVGIGIPVGPFSIGVGVGTGGVSAGIGTGVGPVGVGIGVNQDGQVGAGVGVGASAPIGNGPARVGAGVGTGTVLYDPAAKQKQQFHTPPVQPARQHDGP